MYEELYKAWENEKKNPDLQPLPKDFYVRVSDYLKRIREESRMLDDKTLKARLVKRQSENAKRLVQELIQLRHKKILEASTSGKTLSREALTREEEAVQREAGTLSEFYQKLLENTTQGKLSPAKFELLEAKKSQKTVVRFLRDIPAIVGADMKTYGPFKSEDVAALPRENANILIRQGVAVEVEVET